jgi:malonate-semialdehyde dehydrogenase (acetylating)/methylmalonate-semialdehyde dehydrogenase
MPESVATCRNLVGGEWCEPTASSDLDVISPYSGKVIGKVPLSSHADVARAVAAAKRAAAEWREAPLKERAQRLFFLRDLLYKHLDGLANSAACESGKTVAEGKAGVLKGIEVLEFATSVQNSEESGALEVSRGVTCELRREPVGVCVGITPFNFPAMVPMWMFPIAIALGNAFILKPSEKVPMTACLLGKLMGEAGFPPGLFSIVHGAREVVEALVDHDDVSAVAFVGSTPAARAVYARAGARGKRALCLGGAKNHLIVTPDADPALTVEGVVQSFTGCAGQRCMAASLVLAVGDVDDLIDAIVERASGVAIGRDMGALIDPQAVERLHRGMERASEDGATIRLDGRNVDPPGGYEDGHWFGPSILDRARPSWQCATQELFGPILTIVRVEDIDEALEVGNANPYGNATSIFTMNAAVARYVATRAPSGMVGINIGVPVPREPFSFGGTKASRFGQGDITGRGGIDLWSQLKKITTKWAPRPDAGWMS